MNLAGRHRWISIGLALWKLGTLLPPSYPVYHIQQDVEVVTTPTQMQTRARAHLRGPLGEKGYAHHADLCLRTGHRCPYPLVWTWLFFGTRCVRRGGSCFRSSPEKRTDLSPRSHREVLEGTGDSPDVPTRPCFYCQPLTSSLISPARRIGRPVNKTNHRGDKPIPHMPPNQRTRRFSY